jgi:hypothetical protein
MSLDLALLKILESQGTDLAHFLQNISAIGLMRIEIKYDANQNPEYVGLTLSDATLSDPKWMIRKIVYDANQNPIRVIFANGTNKFDKVFNSYLGYSYSEA